MPILFPFPTATGYPSNSGLTPYGGGSPGVFRICILFWNFLPKKKAAAAMSIAATIAPIAMPALAPAVRPTLACETGSETGGEAVGTFRDVDCWLVKGSMDVEVDRRSVERLFDTNVDDSDEVDAMLEREVSPDTVEVGVTMLVMTFVDGIDEAVNVLVSVTMAAISLAEAWDIMTY